MLNLFLMEYITAGGFQRQELPRNLLPEAIAMRDALLADFCALDVNIITTHDARFGPSEHCLKSMVVDENTHVEAVWEDLLNQCDAALIVAPECDGILLRMTQLLERTKTINLGCHSQAVLLTSNKYLTFGHLVSHQILTIDTYFATDSIAIEQLPINEAYVIKPIDGAGCEQTWIFSSLTDAKSWLNVTSQNISSLIIQPYIAGEAASFTMLCKAGQAVVLSCNTQYIETYAVADARYQRLQYSGGVVNANHHLREVFTPLAAAIASSCADLNGLVGVDVIAQYQPSGDVAQIYVVEINPRITTSYVGLHASITHNPAALMLDCFYHHIDLNHAMMRSDLSTLSIAINLHG